MSEIYDQQPMPMEDLLLTKLIPPRLPVAWIQRSHLFARLDESPEKRLTQVTAPTGFGKTTLVNSWFTLRGYPMAWISLEGDDNDLVRFWRYVIQAIRQIDPEIGKPALAALRTSGQPNFSVLLTGLINELARLPAPTFLVIDEAHTLTSKELLDSFWFFIEHIPATLHVIVLSRRELNGPVALLRARGEFIDLQADDLRFSQEEIEAFLKTAFPNPLSAAFARRVADKTQGWAAGVRLVTLAMQGKAQSPEQVVETFNGEHRFVLEYLRKEVLDRQPEEIRIFLLQTSILDRLCGSLCDQILDRTDSAALLEQLAQAHLFVVPLDVHGGQGWYRYEPLFAEAMRHYAHEVLGEETVQRLYEQASQWYEQRGLLEEAVDASLAGAVSTDERYETAIHLIEQFIQQRRYFETRILSRWYSALPRERLRGHPLVAFHFAATILFSYDRYAPETVAAVEPLLQSAENDWREQGDPAGVGQVLAMRLSMTWWQGDLRRAFELAHQALACLPEDELMWRGAVLLGLGEEATLQGSLYDARTRTIEAQALSGAAQNIHGVLAAMNMLADLDTFQGELDSAAAQYHQVLEDAIGGDEMLDDQSIAWLGLARIAYERNDLSAAEEQAANALELSAKRANESIWVPASILLAQIAQARGQTLQAQAQLQALPGRVRQPQMLWQVWAALSLLALSTGDVPAARRWFDLIEKQPGLKFSSEQGQIDLLAARLWIAEGQPERALPVLNRWKIIFQDQGRLRDEIQALCLEGMAMNSEIAVQPEAAIQRLVSALALGQPKGFRRIFLDEGEPIGKILRQAIPVLRQSSVKIYAAALLHGAALLHSAAPLHPLPAGLPVPEAGQTSVNAPIQAGLVEPLSSQEIRVLRLIAAGRSNPDIASELVVSVNTIKTQVQSIYRKLDVNSRSEARIVARELGLI